MQTHIHAEGLMPILLLTCRQAHTHTKMHTVTGLHVPHHCSKLVYLAQKQAVRTDVWSPAAPRIPEMNHEVERWLLAFLPSRQICDKWTLFLI